MNIKESNRFNHEKTNLFTCYLHLCYHSMVEKKQNITGDSFLNIVNKCNYSVKIYFDDALIGRVDSEEDDTGPYPLGTTLLKARCSYTDDDKAKHNFYEGQTTTVTLEIINKYSNTFQLQSQEIPN